MTWVVWRQFRTQAIVAAAALVALGVFLVITGIQLADYYSSSGLATCQGACSDATSKFLNSVAGSITDKVHNLNNGVMYVLPAIIGVFWGAPLIARELEAGTYRLAWNQSVTRRRWLATKLLTIGLATVTVAGLLSLMVTWWMSSIDHAGKNMLSPAIFGARGVIPIGYAAFAFMLGVVVGVVIRRTVPAMAATLAIVVFAQIAMPLWIRGHLLPPVRETLPLDVTQITSISSVSGGHMTIEAAASTPGAWLLSNETITSSGAVFTGPANMTACNRNTSPESCINWLGTLHLRQALTYIPQSRFWPLQWIETSIFLALALALVGVCFWWVRRRLA